MEDRGGAGLGSGFDVGRAANDNAGDRQCTQTTAQGVGDTLSEEFLVVVGAHAIVHAIHRGRAEKGFRARDQGEANDRSPKRRSGEQT